MNTTMLVLEALTPLIAGTAFEADTANNAGIRAAETATRRSASLIWCAATPQFRARHPGVPEALDHEHPDGCTDLMVEVDDDGLLVRVDIEMLSVADDLAGQPIDEVLTEVVDRLRELLHQ